MSIPSSTQSQLSALASSIASQGLDIESPAHEIAQVVDVMDDDLSLGSNLFVNSEPAMPNSCITVYDYGEGDSSPNLAIDQVKVQVRARDKSFANAYRMLHKIKLALQSIPSLNLDDKRIIGVWVVNGIAAAGRDQNDRNILTLSLRVAIEPNNKGHRQ